MGGVPVAIVHVVGVIAVRNRNVTAAEVVLVVMILMSTVLAASRAFVHVVPVDAMDVPVVGKVCVVAVRHSDVAAALAVGVRVTGVRCMLDRTGHSLLNPPVVCAA
jgi:hypothetical protein